MPKTGLEALDTYTILNLRKEIKQKNERIDALIAEVAKYKLALKHAGFAVCDLCGCVVDITDRDNYFRIANTGICARCFWEPIRKASDHRDDTEANIKRTP